MSRKHAPEINAGSMADIAFLLLIFFLVTTTMQVDAGISRKIPKKQEQPPIAINNRNILEININKNNELFVDDKVANYKELKQMAINFIDNGGGLDINQKECNWCNGLKDKYLSDHPTKAIISLKTDRLTNYESYIATIDVLNSAYTHLRNRLSVKLYHQNYESLLEDFKLTHNTNLNIQKKIKVIREKYPLLLSDAEMNF